MCRLQRTGDGQTLARLTGFQFAGVDDLPTPWGFETVAGSGQGPNLRLWKWAPGLELPRPDKLPEAVTTSEGDRHRQPSKWQLSPSPIPLAPHWCIVLATKGLGEVLSSLVSVSKRRFAGLGHDGESKKQMWRRKDQGPVIASPGEMVWHAYLLRISVSISTTSSLPTTPPVIPSVRCWPSTCTSTSYVLLQSPPL